MSACPWYVSAAAVRRWQEIIPSAPRDFDDASDRLIEICAAIWQRYASGEREPYRTRTGALRYDGGKPEGRIRIIVSAERRAEGEKSQVVDVVPRSSDRS